MMGGGGTWTDFSKQKGFKGRLRVRRPPFSDAIFATPTGTPARGLAQVFSCERRERGEGGGGGSPGQGPASCIASSARK